ncbi:MULTISPECIES: nucleoside-diphosphate sugar epimerase/dehydratase [unclassified Adlercreutzia]|uniref:polysaccharide biosynthesis protein n=1 Tax=unclassified Adlercreutzia TaxID=2636013 RepID=UPI0013EBFF34|nr:MULTISPECIES: nucleoside-diphosphate sugar epimerase/dehydratase [unclassified Adlercreutzia]
MTVGTGKARALVKATPLVVLDVAATVVAYVAAAWSTGTLGTVLDAGGFAQTVALAVLVNVVVFALGQMYNSLWEYASVDELARVALVALAASAAADVVAALSTGRVMPPQVYFVAWLILTAVCGASRFAIRLYSGRKGWSVLGVSEKSGLPRSLVVGAGETGSLTVKRMLAGNPDMPGFPVALVDDEPSKVGRYIHGVKVLGTCDDIPSVCASDRVDQIVLAVPSATKAQRDRIYELCIQTGVRTLTLPLIQDMPRDLDDRIPLREVEVSDLLAREEKALDLCQMGYVAGKRVLVTGGGGSIGSELVRQLLPAKPASIVLFDIYENTTYELYHEIKGRCEKEGIGLEVEIGSITNPSALEKCFDEHAPQVVFHAAAHKHVPLMEANAREAVENNMFGTLNVVRLAHERKCGHFILVSTDKAVNPVNVMGATKRMCEMIVQHYAARSETVFAAVRFGNVLGSHGSVIPLFKRQLREGGPITVTHRDITRYFMTIPEASRLVITAGAMACGGEIFILDMGEPVRIWDLAENLVRLSGLEPGRDIEIRETGLRPGEKLYEELLMDGEHTIPTDNADIMVLTGDALDVETVKAKLEQLSSCLDKSNDEIKRVLAEAVPTYHPKHENVERSVYR